MQRTYRLKKITPKDVDFRSDNPRRESTDQIVGDPSFEQLKDSVYQFGVLVPIVVHEQKGKGKKPYVLVDGERRLRAALETGVRWIPAHVASRENLKNELVQAFHIHMLRKQWRSVATAVAVKVIYRRLKAENPRKSERELLEELHALIGCSDTVFRAISQAIRYDDSVLKEVESGTLAWSYLVQFEASFVEQLEQHFPSVLAKYGKDTIRTVLLDKARGGVLTNTRVFIENIMPVIARAAKRNEKAYAASLLQKFIDDTDMPAEEVLRAYETRYPGTQEDVVRQGRLILEQAEALEALIEQWAPGRMAGFPALGKRIRGKLESLKRALSKRLRSLKRHLS